MIAGSFLEKYFDEMIAGSVDGRISNPGTSSPLAKDPKPEIAGPDETGNGSSPGPASSGSSNTKVVKILKQNEPLVS